MMGADDSTLSYPPTYLYVMRPVGLCMSVMAAPMSTPALRRRPRNRTICMTAENTCEAEQDMRSSPCNVEAWRRRIHVDM
jgi:hypothetical protein